MSQISSTFLIIHNVEKYQNWSSGIDDIWKMPDENLISHDILSFEDRKIKIKIGW